MRELQSNNYLPLWSRSIQKRQEIFLTNKKQFFICYTFFIYIWYRPHLRLYRFSIYKLQGQTIYKETNMIQKQCKQMWNLYFFAFLCSTLSPSHSWTFLNKRSAISNNLHYNSVAFISRRDFVVVVVVDVVVHQFILSIQLNTLIILWIILGFIGSKLNPNSKIELAHSGEAY